MTINKWRKDLEKYGCIKKSSMWQYEFVLDAREFVNILNCSLKLILKTK